jgi:hypothetical protein
MEHAVCEWGHGGSALLQAGRGTRPRFCHALRTLTLTILKLFWPTPVAVVDEDVKGSQFLGIASERTSPMRAVEILRLMNSQYIGYTVTVDYH